MLNNYIWVPTTKVILDIASRSILFDKDYTGNFTIAPYEPEFIKMK